MLALDPPLGEGDAATIGGVIATGDSGPLRHRYGAPRDLVLGMTVALSDGTVAKAGSRVIKNVAGYDLAKLFSGSFGTLGLILQVTVRLHPLPSETVTALGRSNDPEVVARGASALAHASLEKECVDVRWEVGEGSAMARLGGATAGAQAEAAARVLRDAGLETEIVEDDASLWQRQRDAQRSADGAVVRVSGLQTDLARTIRAADSLGGRLVGRASLGISWIALPPQHVHDLRRALSEFSCVVLDAPLELRSSLDVWDAQPLELARRVKQRFDPAGVFAPGTFAGGI
jgi:glycolate oxidase FAD binding subunit